MNDSELWNAIEEAVDGRWTPTGRESEDQLRMLGYAAELRDAVSPDPTGNLLRLMTLCNARLPDAAPRRDYRDVTQARWGAPRALTDAVDAPLLEEPFPARDVPVGDAPAERGLAGPSVMDPA